jgi:two-component system chemotaxis sensor kinase CheA
LDDLIQEFITETSESLSTLDLELVKLEQNPNDTEILGNIFRLVHTIKGTCGFLGLPRLESVAHAGENVLGKIRDKQIDVTSHAISLVLESLDAIKGIMEYLGEHGEEPKGDDSDLIRRLNQFADSNGAVYEGPGGEGVAASSEPVPAAELVSIDDFVPVPATWVPDPEPEVEPVTVAEAVPTVMPEARLPEAVRAVSPQVKQEAVEKGLATTDAKGGGDSASIRVSLSVLENLMQMVGELVLTRNQLMQIVRTREDTEIKAPLQHLSHITTELQEGVMKTRMQPIGNAWAKFPRLIRDLSLELNKKIDLKMVGAETELDRQLLEMIKDPLTHMVRNSCDHGLELPEQRRDAGKPETGMVTLSAYHEGGHIIIEISDDGRGINIDRVKEKAIQNGIATEADIAQMSEKQIMQFIFRAGFSTAEKVTSVSGRGVGMDVVRANIEKIGGTVELESKVGFGSTFHIKIPLTLAIVSVLIVEASGQRFAVPQINVLELVRTGSESETRMEVINNSPVLRLRDKLLPLLSLAGVLEMNGRSKNGDIEGKYIVVLKIGATDFGLIVDNIFDTEEIVVKPVSSLIKHIPVYSGNTVLGDGSVIMILDPNGIVRSMNADFQGTRSSASSDLAANAASERMVNFLLFKTHNGTPKAVPLELVSRLEEIDAKTIEFSDGQPVVQYRGGLMALTTLHDEPVPTEGMCEVIVFSYDNKTVGLLVEEILDITLCEATVKKAAKNRIYLGSIVVLGKSTDVVDVGYLLAQVLDTKMDFNIEGMLGGQASHVKLLFVEDSMFFRSLTVPFLTAVGYQVTAVPSAKEALALLERQKMDIIVTDIEMPEMDGFTLTRVIRATPKLAHLPVIGFSATMNSEIERLKADCQMNDFVMKTERERLIKAIAECLSVNVKEVA